MPKFDGNDELQKHNLTGHYGFSAAKIDTLGASEYTLVSILVDESGSTASFIGDMEKCIKEIINSCKYSPRCDNLLLRICAFDDKFRELNGFKPLENVNADDYIGSLHPGGTTALFDSSFNVIEATNAYGKDLIKNDFSVNGIIFVITDGCDNVSKFTANNVKNELVNSLKQENLESLVSILIGVNVSDSSVSAALNDFHKVAGFTQYVEIENADSKTLAKLAEFVSKSISSQSQSLKSGGASAPLTF